MSYPFYIIFGVLPSIIWLLFYLRKDTHPESSRMILKIFFYGMLIAFPAILFEIGLLQEIKRFDFSPLIISLLSVFVGVAMVEELLKYFVVKEKVLNSAEFDEPIDTVLYMIIAALGFAAAENILILFSLGPAFVLEKTISLSVFRFLGATFLHVLASGILGYFLAMSICQTKYRGRLLLSGLVIAILLHGLYNFSIIELGGEASFFIPLIILISSAIFLTAAFKKLKKLKSVCKI
ncbi:MAG: PrsW family intramembrane metalloprotease [bacterium]|nr:PrsW family intramembrane metalloprotease [bacterium]